MNLTTATKNRFSEEDFIGMQTASHCLIFIFDIQIVKIERSGMEWNRNEQHSSIRTKL